MKRRKFSSPARLQRKCLNDANSVRDACFQGSGARDVGRTIFTVVVDDQHREIAWWVVLRGVSGNDYADRRRFIARRDDGDDTRPPIWGKRRRAISVRFPDSPEVAAGENEQQPDQQRPAGGDLSGECESHLDDVLILVQNRIMSLFVQIAMTPV